MKVLFIFNGLPHYYIGVLNKLSAEKNVEISLVVPSQEGKNIGKGVYQSEEGIRFSFYKLDEYKTWYRREFFKGYKKIIKKLRPDIVVTTWPYSLAFVLLPQIFLITKLYKIKFIQKEIPFGVPKAENAYNFYTTTSMYSESMTTLKINPSIFSRLKIFFLTLIRKIIYNYADAHVNYTKDAFDIFGSYGVKAEKIFIIYNSPDTEKLLKIKTKLEEEGKNHVNYNRIIHIGRLVKWKRVDMIIRVISRLKNNYPEIELLVIGDGPEKENLIKLSGELNIIDKVNFVGGIYDAKQIGSHLLSSAIYVLAGMGGLSINEAMTFGKPIICSFCDGTEKELVRSEFNGYVFEDGNENDLYVKIKSLLDDKEAIIKMGENSLHIIKNEININTVINGYLKAFNYVLKSPK